MSGAQAMMSKEELADRIVAAIRYVDDEAVQRDAILEVVGAHLDAIAEAVEAQRAALERLVEHHAAGECYLYPACEDETAIARAGLLRGQSVR